MFKIKKCKLSLCLLSNPNKMYNFLFIYSPTEGLISKRYSQVKDANSAHSALR